MTQREPDLSINDVAEELAVSRRKVWDMVKFGELESYRVGRIRRIRRESLDAFKQTTTVPMRAPRHG